MGAIKREMNNARWTTFAIAYQCVFAYLVGLVIYQIGSALNGQIHIIGVLVAAAIVAGTLYMLFRPYREATKLTTMN